MEPYRIGYSCGIIIGNTAVRCKDCSAIKRRKINNRPSHEELLNLLRNNSFLAVGKMYNVTDNTIRKWLK